MTCGWRMLRSCSVSALAALLWFGGQIAAQTPATPHVRYPLGLIEPDYPLRNPPTPLRIDLGKRLFFDLRLSASGKTSCGTCHLPNLAFAENRSISLSDRQKILERNAPTLFNSGYLATLGWDGRFRTLEDQASEPFSRDGDMGLGLDSAISLVQTDSIYRRMFEAAYGAEPSVLGVRRALAAYERSLVSAGTRADRFLFAADSSALDPLERTGLELFLGRAGCVTCHDVFAPLTNPLGGRLALFTDLRFHNLGVGYADGRMKDVGRYLVTRDPDDWGAFKTPSLRNVALTAPYMHDGSLSSLEAVIDFYDQGGVQNPNLSPTIQPLYLSVREKHALVAFLRALTDPGLEADSHHR